MKPVYTAIAIDDRPYHPYQDGSQSTTKQVKIWEADFEESDLTYTEENQRWRWFPWFLHSLLLVISLVAGFGMSKISHDPSCLNEHSDALLNPQRQPFRMRFDGSFRGSSPYKGPPSPAVDKAWDELINIRLMSIPESVFVTLNASQHSFKLDPEFGGGRLAIFDTMHMLHCVRSLWKLAYPEYYGDNGGNNTSERTDGSRREFLNHADHCADMLRQKLMCDASSAIVTYNWVENHHHPHPNFNVEHTCRSYEQLAATVDKYAVKNLPPNGFFRPRKGAVVEFAEPPFDPQAVGRMSVGETKHRK
ncbi:unnamed protein product [Periconia digitata]|uniref:Uncharacterized protein n=1 Tax=Periconia digitata TaxID=1303443 RepID=A0A9W4XJ75_9PLEO|nr:unnamed protein product [Periconia digitata]